MPRMCTHTHIHTHIYIKSIFWIWLKISVSILHQSRDFLARDFYKVSHHERIEKEFEFSKVNVPRKERGETSEFFKGQGKVQVRSLESRRVYLKFRQVDKNVKTISVKLALCLFQSPICVYHIQCIHCEFCQDLKFALPILIPRTWGTVINRYLKCMHWISVNTRQ